MSFAPSRAVVDLAAYMHNVSAVRERIPSDCLLCAMVKADGYGHGAVPIARAATAAGATMLGVATVDEAMTLREAGLALPIVVAVQPPPDALRHAVRHGFRVVLPDEESARQASRYAAEAGTVARVHCKVDTGMGRQGMLADAAFDAITRISALPNVRLEGVLTHFPIADEPDNPFTLEQFSQFRALLDRFRAASLDYGIAHAANSAAVVAFPQTALDMVRPGLMTYGVWPLNAPEPTPGTLRPVLRWETAVLTVRALPAGATIGYGRTYQTGGPARVALLPVGYADGYRTRFANHADVLIRGARCPVRGRVSMDQTVVDVSHLPTVGPGDTAVLLGVDGTEEVTAVELARLGDTIPYDIFTGIGARVQRVYVNPPDDV